MLASVSVWTRRCVALAALVSVVIFSAEVGATAPPASGTSLARVCRWYGGKQAALSLRFDDSHPTQIEVALPLLNARGLIGTFLVNPGNENFQRYRKVWEGEVLQHGHELADHTWNHHGAQSDAEADAQIGQTADLLRRLQPGHAQITFEPGGATLWMQRKPFAFFDAKYHLYDINDTVGTGHEILSCTEAHPWFTVEAFRKQLDRVIAEGGWFQPYFHQIAKTGGLPITPEHFRQVIDIVTAHRAQLWQAGMTALHEYEQERDNAAVWPLPVGKDGLRLDLTCGTDSNLYNQPLTLEVDLPAGTTAAAVTDAAGKAIPSRIESGRGGLVLRFDVPPVDARFLVHARGLGAVPRPPSAAGMAVATGNLATARPRLPEVKAPGPHPYVFFSAAEVPALVARDDPMLKQMYERILQRADRLVTRDPATEPRSSETWPRMGQEFPPIEALSFAYALTHKPAYAAAVAPRLEALAREDWWHEGKAEMLITAEAADTLALAYDWVYDALTESQRAQIRTAIVEYGLKPVAAASERNEWWTNWYHSNWGAAIFGQAGVAALAVLGEEPQAADWVRLCQRKIWHYTHALNEDGSWGEGATYGAYAWQNAIAFADALHRVTGDDLLDLPRLHKLPQWFIGLLDPSGKNFVPFSNCWDGSTGSPASLLFRLAHEYRDGYAQYYALKQTGRRSGDPFTFLWYDPTVTPKPFTQLPLDTLFRDLDWAFLRSSREDPQATLFGLKGGHKEWDHSQHDTNSFVLYAHGKPLLIDLFYPHDIWGVKTEAHNTIMVDGKEQAGHVNVAGGRDSADHLGVVAGFIDTPWYAHLVGDASLAYEPTNVKSFVREVMYLRQSETAAPPDYFVMLDDVETPTPKPVDWLLHTYGEVTRDDQTLHVTQDDAAVDVTLVSPDTFTTDISEKNLTDIKVPHPFPSARVVRTIKVRPATPARSTFFLSVLAPRAASAPAPLRITPVRQPHVLGAEIDSQGTQDLALFALAAPKISARGVEAVGRTCFVRTSGGRLRGAALYRGQRLSANGHLLFATNSAGQVVLTFREDGVDAKCDLYDSDQVQIHVDRAPTKVVVDGRPQAFAYDQATQCVTIHHYALHEVHIQY